jgi:broad specificity phosphatase PhoE
MREAILARHGETVLSVEGNVNGDPAIAVPLTDTGRAQAGGSAKHSGARRSTSA